MKNELTFTAISLEEQIRILGGEDMAPKPKKNVTTQPKSKVSVGDGNTFIFNLDIFTFKF